MILLWSSSDDVCKVVIFVVWIIFVSRVDKKKLVVGIGVVLDMIILIIIWVFLSEGECLYY